MSDACQTVFMARSDTELLEEMTRWLKILGIQEVRPIFGELFDFDEEAKARSGKIAYELTDGKNSQRDIEEHIDFSYQWVSSRQNEWAQHGLVEKESVNSPYRKIVSLTEIGIEVDGFDDILDEMEDDEDE